MYFKNHPEKDQIKKYINQELPEEDLLFLGEHIADCDYCATIARGEAEFNYLWDAWTPSEHGYIYWQRRVKETLHNMKNDSPLISQRIRKWKEDFNSRIGSMLRLCRQKVGNIFDVVTGLSGDRSMGGFSLVAAQPIRGTGEDSLVRFQVPEGLPLEVDVDRSSGTFRIKVEDELTEPPLILLIFKTREPLLLVPEKIEGTSFSSISFTPEEECYLFIEPLAG